MRRINIRKIFSLTPILFGSLFALLNIFQYAGEPTLGADIVSRVLPAIAHRIGLGMPYVNYWEITPPGHYIVLDIWAQFFGFTGLSIKILHIVTSFGIVLLVYYVLGRFLKGFYLVTTSSAVYLFLFSTRLTTFILPAEILGLLFSLAGLASLFYFLDYKKALLISSFLFLFSGQVKDPYLFSSLSLIPYILFLSLRGPGKFFTGVLYSLLGILLGIFLNIFYLWLLGSLTEYFTVLSYKSKAFEVFDVGWLFEKFFIHLGLAKDVFFYIPYPVLLPLLVYLVIKIYSKTKDKSIVLRVLRKSKSIFIKGDFLWKLGHTNWWTLIFYIVGLSIGFVIQRSLGSHYYIIAVFPLVVIVGICFMGIDHELSKFSRSLFLRILLVIIFVAFLLPDKAYITGYNFNKIFDLRFLPRLMLWANANSESPIVKRIKAETDKNDCVSDIYGWGVGTTYLYSERRSCSRFFITSLVNQDWQREEYKRSMLINNPKAIIYKPNAGDLDHKRFEETVVNFTKMLKNCYIRDQEFETLYFPKYKDRKLLECLQSSLF